MKRLRVFAGDLGVSQTEYEEITAQNTYKQDEQKHKAYKLKVFFIRFEGPCGCFICQYCILNV